MSKLALNKTTLNKERSQLRSYKQFLPSLDLKKKQLLIERSKAKQKLFVTHNQIQKLNLSIHDRLPMLSNNLVDLMGLVKVTSVQLNEEVVLGSKLPVIHSIDIEAATYSFLAKPQWVDFLVEELRSMFSLKIQAQVEEKRLEILKAATTKITQRVNLFEKILIPKTMQNIKRIQVYLWDVERSAVVRAKISKQKFLKESEDGYPTP